MGGYGSGPRSNKPATSEAKRVDIRYLRKHGLLRPGSAGSLNWTSRDEPSGSIRYRVEQNGETLVLDYRVREPGSEWDQMAVAVPIESVPCRYGGGRQYFCCPNRGCNHRCEVLFSFGVYFVCRKCCGYLYPSQKGDKLDKLREARDKLGARIFEDWDGSYGWRKRKGMHWRTFEKQNQRYRALDAAWDMTYCAMARALLGRDAA